MIDVKYLTDNSSILVCDANGLPLMEHNADILRRSASLIKLFIADYYITKHCNIEPLETDIEIPRSQYTGNSVLSELRQGRVTLFGAIAAMIACSDNAATNILIGHCGGFDILNTHISSEIGAKNTHIMRKMLDFKAAEAGRDNVSTARDCFLCLSRLAEIPLAQSLLNMQKDKERLMRYIIKDVGFMGKSGNIEGVFNDAGVFNNRSGDRVFAVVMTEHMERGEAKRLCGRVGLFAYGSGDRIVTGSGL